MSDKNVQQIYDFLNDFLCETTGTDESMPGENLFTGDSVCNRELESIYQKRHELLTRGVSERDLDVIFDGFEMLMRVVGERMYACGAWSARRFAEG